MVDDVPTTATAIILSLQFHGGYDPLLRDMMLDIYRDAELVVVHVYHWISQQEINLAYQYLHNFKLYARSNAWRGVQYLLKDITIDVRHLKNIKWEKMLSDPKIFISTFSTGNVARTFYNTYVNHFFTISEHDLKHHPTGDDVA